MKRNPKPWTKVELTLLGTHPHAEVAELTGRTFGMVWQKRRTAWHRPAGTTIPKMDAS